MAQGQEFMKKLIRLLSAEGQPKKTVFAQTRMGVFFIRSMYDKFLQCFFFRNRRGPSRNRRVPLMVRGPQFDKH
jgi:hypothetical protein